MNLKSLLVTFIVFCLYHCADAQQRPVVSQYMQSKIFLNPAATGADGQGHVKLLHRSQWAGYSTYDNASGAAPQMQLLMASLRLKHRSDSTDSSASVVKHARHGVGAVIFRDRAASLTTIETKVSYAYHIPLSPRSTLGLGMQAGVQFQTVDYAKFRVVHHDDPWLPEKGKESQGHTALMLGLWYEGENLYVGLSFDGITGNALDEFDAGAGRTWIGTAGYRFNKGKYWTISPSLLAMTNSEKYLLGMGIAATYLNAFWCGVTYRHEDAVTALLGVGLLEQRRFSIHYAMDYITSNVGIKTNTSHEVMLGYKWH